MNQNYAQSLTMLGAVADALGELTSDVVFVGGAVVGLLLDHPAAAAVRQTLDVDIVAEVVTQMEYYELADRLRARGFREDSTPGAPVCRWQVGGVTVDVMAPDAKVVGFTNTWYAEMLRHSSWVNLANSVQVRVITGPYLVATKLEAYEKRGKGDAEASHDVEDIVTLLDGRARLLDEVAISSAGVKKFVYSRLADLFSGERGLDVLQAHLGSDKASQERALPIQRDLLDGVNDQRTR